MIKTTVSTEHNNICNTTFAKKFRSFFSISDNSTISNNTCATTKDEMANLIINIVQSLQDDENEEKCLMLRLLCNTKINKILTTSAK